MPRSTSSETEQGHRQRCRQECEPFWRGAKGLLASGLTVPQKAEEPIRLKVIPYEADGSVDTGA